MLQSFRSRLLAALIGVLLASLALFFGLTWGQLRDYYRQTRLDELHLRLKLISGWIDPLSGEVKDALHKASADIGVALLLVYPDRQQRFYASDGYALTDAQLAGVRTVLDEELPLKRDSTRHSGELLVITQLVPLADGQSALLAAVTPEARLESGWRRLLTPLGYAALFGLFISMLLAWLLARSLARPVNRLTAAAGRVAQGIYDDPPLKAGKDELGRLVSVFQSMREQIGQAQQTQRDFLSGVSHDLKTPLAVIQGYASALEDGIADDEVSRQRVIAGIRRETERMTGLVASLLELARLEAGLTPFEPAALDLGTLVRKVLGELGTRAQPKDLHLQEALPEKLPPVQADPTQIERVLMNLLENAIRFTPGGGTIGVGGAAQAGRVSLWIQDSGPGIPQEALPHIFDRFYQFEPARTTGRSGSGLGLTIAREIMKRHGGEIYVQSEIGQGARFTISLPCSPYSPH
jgi:signal transduction histidine kinase